ncbi:MAG: Uncharacterized protein G01um101420_195 [Parcubacteria group bacterium Gr01-1014_20]|nr:MAG: Uncharacterized protein G01um101420_195 [Parcubacteria group bacterium Gr01-1014_20]
MFFNQAKKFRNGQSLIEILVAIAVGVVMLGVAISIIAPVLKANTRTNEAKVAAALGRELLENTRVFVERDWNNLAVLSTSSLYSYHLTTSTAAPDFPFRKIDGVESIVISSTTYLRHFNVDDVCRSGNGIIQADPGQCIYVDPSTKKVSVVYGWLGGSTSSFSTYFTRFKNRSMSQSDWSGGDSFWGPTTTTTTRFVTSTNTTSTNGIIRIEEVISG